MRVSRPARHPLARLGRLLRRHWNWIRRGLASGHTRLVALYLVLVAGLVGYAAGGVTGYEIHEVIERRSRVPKPWGPPPEGRTWVEAKTTGYCPCAICCGKDADGRTAINRDVLKHPYGIAVEPKLIPYRSTLFVPGYGEALVDDTGGAMRQSARRGILHLDLRFKDHQTARRWGVQWHWIAVPSTSPAAALADKSQ